MTSRSPNGHPRIVIPDGMGGVVDAARATMHPTMMAAQVVVGQLCQSGIPDFAEGLAKMRAELAAQDETLEPAPGVALGLEIMEAVASWQARAQALVAKAKALEEASGDP
jgi:hypothetical protein